MPDLGRPTSTHAAQRIDPTSLEGDWINTESSPRALARILIERRSDALAVRPLGVEGSPPDGVEWFESRALYASSSTGGDAVAFIAERDSGPMPVELHANLSKGLLIVSSFQTRLLSHGRERRFAREFFRRADSASPGLSDLSANDTAARPLSTASSASTFVGTWRNTNSEGPGIVSVSFAATDDDSTMRIVARDDSGSHDWGTTAVEIYTELGTASEPAKIKARYDLGLLDVLLHGWVKQGVLVLALFRRFKDESVGSNYFDREFFYRTDEPPKVVG